MEDAPNDNDNEDLSLLDAIRERESLHVLQSIVKERPESVRVRTSSHQDRYPEGNTALLLAVRGKLPVDTIRFLYFAWPEALHEKDEDGCNPIHYLMDKMYGGVVGENNGEDYSLVEVATFLVEQCPDALHEKDECGMSPFHRAAANPSLPPGLFRFLVEHTSAAQLREPGGLGHLPIHAAAAWGRDPGAIRALLDADPESIHEKDDDGMNPLHHAASGYSVSLVQLLIERGPRALLLERDDMGRVPLHCVTAEFADDDEGGGGAEHPFVGITRVLVDACPESVRVRGNDGRLPLHVASEWGKIELVRVLVRAWPESVREADEDGRLALHRALASEEEVSAEDLLETARFLIEEWPESIRTRDRTGQTLVHMVVVSSTKMDDPEQVLDFLDERIRDCYQMQDQQGQVPLHLVKARDMAERLVDTWPPAVRVRDRAGRLPVHAALARAAAMKHHYIIDGSAVLLLRAARALAEAWPDSLLVPDETSRLPLHVLAECSGIASAAREVAGSALYFVETRPQALQARDREGRLPLHVWAAQRNSSLAVAHFPVRPWPESLLVADHHGRLPLHVLLRCADATLDRARLLVQTRPESLHVQDHQGRLPLHALVSQPNATLDVARLLMGRYSGSLQVQIPDHQGQVPLHVLVSQPNPSLDIARLVIKVHSGSLQVQDNQGRIPLVVAATIQDPSLDMVRLLIKACPQSLQLLNPEGLVPLQAAAAHDAPLDIVYFLARQRPELLRSHSQCGVRVPSSANHSLAGAERPRKQARR